GDSMNMWLSLLIVVGLFGLNVADLVGSFGGLGMAGGVIRSWDMRHYYGLTLPNWIAPVLTYLLIGLTLAAVASARLETFPERKAGKLRLLVLLLFLQQLFFYFGARFTVLTGPGAGAMGAGLPLLYSLIY